MTPFDRALSVSRLLGRMAQENSMSSPHVEAISVTLPASLFDEICRSAERDGIVRHAAATAAPQASAMIGGIKFVRGAEDAAIRDAAGRRAGLSR